MIHALGYFFTEAFLSLWRGRRASGLSVLTITIGLFVLGVFLVATANLQMLVSRWSSAAEFSVYLRDTASDAEKAAIARAARAHPSVAAVEAVTKPEALQRFTRDFPDLAAAAKASPNNPFPASFEIRLASARTDTAAVERLARTLGAMPGVTDVRYDRRWLDRLASVAGAIRWMGLALSAVLILAAALTIANVVRLALASRRDEVEIMELVGAPIAFIRGPFICEGILQGAIGGVLALVALRMAFAFGRDGIDTVARLAGAEGAVFLSAGTALLVVVGGAAVGCAGSFFAVRRFR